MPCPYFLVLAIFACVLRCDLAAGCDGFQDLLPDIFGEHAHDAGFGVFLCGGFHFGVARQDDSAITAGK